MSARLCRHSAGMPIIARLAFLPTLFGRDQSNSSRYLMVLDRGIGFACSNELLSARTICVSPTPFRCFVTETRSLGCLLLHQAGNIETPTNVSPGTRIHKSGVRA